MPDTQPACDRPAPQTLSVTFQGETRELRTAALHELPALAAADTEAFGDHRDSSLAEYREIAESGHVIVLRDQHGGLIGCAQLLLKSALGIELRRDEAYCHGSFVVEAHRDERRSPFLHRAQEKLAREAGKSQLTLTVRADNPASLNARLKAGFQIVDYRSSYYGDWPTGARLVLQKSLVTDLEPFAIEEHRRQIESNDATRVEAAEVARACRSFDEIALQSPEGQAVSELTDAASTLIDAGYVGVGWAPYGEGSPPLGACVYRRRGAVPSRQLRSLAVADEFSPLRSVIVNYDSFTAAIDEEDAINATAEANIDNVDGQAELDEYRAFVSALQREGAEVIRNGARGSNGRFARFARDSAFVVGETPFLAHLMRSQRQPEGKAVSHLFRSRAPVDLRRHHDAFVEGGDVLPAGPGRLIVGVGQRTNAAGVDALQAALPDHEIIRVHHSDLHLDVLFTIVGTRLALAHRQALPDDFLRWLAAERYELVACDPIEQVTLGCNVITVGERRVIAAAGNSRTNAALRDHGVEVVEVEMPNIVKHGGGPRCMTCPIARGGTP
jgi:N-dimethylarginine dimethylaminohydrolase